MTITEVMHNLQDHLLVNISGYNGKPMSDAALIVLLNQSLNEIYTDFTLATDQAIIAVPSETRVFTLEPNRDPNYTWDNNGVQEMRIARDPNVILGVMEQIKTNEYGKAKREKEEANNKVMDNLLDEFKFKR